MKAVLLQLEVADRPKEEAVARALARLDAAPPGELVVLPELWPSGFFAFERYRAEAEPLDGPTVEAFAARAAARGCHLLMGSLVERAGEAFYNTAVLLDPAGRVAAAYRKIHLFGYQSQEREILSAGSAPVVAAAPWGGTGIATCYDLRFPELFRGMVDRGARFFLVASAWPHARLEAWRLFCRARAHENLAVLIACNCAGVNRGVRFAGHSLVVDPWGRPLAEAGEGEETLTVAIDPQAVERARAEFPALADRRRDLSF